MKLSFRSALALLHPVLLFVQVSFCATLSRDVRWNDVIHGGSAFIVSGAENPKALSSGDAAYGNKSETEDTECNLGGRTIKVAVSSQPPLVDCQQDFGGDWNCNGSNIEAIKVLQQKLNFKVEWLVLSSASGNGHAIETNSKLQRSSGSQSRENVTTTNRIILALVESGRAWMSGNGYMSIINGRDNDKLKISRPFDVFRMHFLLSKSVRDHDHIFVKPFNSKAWLAILSSALLIVPAFYLINKTSCYYFQKDVKHLKHISLWQCLRFKLAKLFRSVCQLGRRSSQFPTDLELIESVVAEANPLHGIEPKLVIMKAEEQRRKKMLRKQMALERRRALRLGRRSRRSGFFRVAYVAWYVIGSLAAQGGETEDLPEADSTRILVAFWWLYLIVIVSIHSGILTAILTFPKQNDFIQTLDDFMALERNERSGMHLAVDKFSEISDLLADSSSSHRSPLHELMIGEQPLVPIVEVDLSRHRERVLDEVQRGKSAYLEEKSAINLIITQEYFDQKPPKCQFKSSRFPIDIIPMSLALSRRRFSPVCLKRIDRILAKIMQTGLAQKWRRRFDAQGNDCLETVIINAGDVAKIELRHVELAFWLLLGGLTLGACILATEVIWLFTSELDVDDDYDGGGGKDCEKRTSGGNINSSSSSSLSSDSAFGSSSSSSSSSSSGDDEMRLGHRVGLLAQRSLRTLKLNRASRLIKIKSRQLDHPHPHPHPEQEDQEHDGDEENEGPAVVLERRLKEARVERRRKRLARAAERRARRLRRTMGLVKRLQEGKLYTDLLPKVSDKIQARARRASHAIVSHFTGLTMGPHPEPQPQLQLQIQPQLQVQLSAQAQPQPRPLAILGVDGDVDDKPQQKAAQAPAAGSSHHEPRVRRRRQNNNSNTNNNNRLTRVSPATTTNSTTTSASH